MNNLVEILDILKNKKGSFKGKYYIPSIWADSSFTSFSTNRNQSDEIMVNPYEFITYSIEKNILSCANKNINYLPSIDIKSTKMPDLSRSVIYSILPRMFTAWDHYKKNDLISGSFIKCICLLPYLKNLGVNIIYLLPIFEYSDKYKKRRTR